MNVREKLVELLSNIYFLMIDGPDTIGEYTIPHKFKEKIADHLISNGVTVQEWISVNDRLPKPFESVLVFRDGKISIDYNEGNGWFAYDFNGKRVTHWMPLPLAPAASGIKKLQ